MSLDVVIPHLLLPPQAPAALRELRLPHLERWIARADVERLDMPGPEAWLAQRFDLPAPFPIAAVTLAADDAPQPGMWLRADPVHLQISPEAVALHDASVLDVQGDEARSLVDTLQALFGADGLEFRAPHPARWYVRVPAGELPDTTPLESALGRNVFGLLPRGRGRINWATAITEVQMLFSSHEVNAQREAAGRAAINSVWFWGGGATPRIASRPYALVYALDAFARGLGTLAGARVAELPSRPELVDAVAEDDSVLVVLDALGAPLHRGDANAWREAARALDEAWFSELGRLLERFERVRLVLPAQNETRIATIASASRWRWFRRRSAVNA
ncbi:MAG: hypothetical protein ACM3SO_08615 [Betaproteobacteria bacterium]